jgi:hypothetical protein
VIPLPIARSAGYAFISGDALGENAISCDPSVKLCPLSLTHLLRPFSESDNALENLSAICMQGDLKTSDAKPADRRNTAGQARRKQHISDAAPCSGLSANRKQFGLLPDRPSERIAND